MADSLNKRLRAIKARIEAAGGTVEQVEHGRHVKIWFMNPKGEPKMMIVSVSPSDHRAEKDVVARLRRLLAG